MNRYDLSKMDTDFIGFTFNGKHSADFGILRTSDGGRYEESFVPDISDEAEAIPGGHGEYYVGETVKSKEFKIEFAYDCLNETGLRRIRRWLHPDDQLHELIFDERPYVKYWVKCSKAVTSQGLCFNQYNYNTGKIERVYKGEGTIEFTAYMPYGIEVNKDLDYFTNANKEEWGDAAGLIEGYKDSGLDVFTQSPTAAAQRYIADIYNPGDVESDFVLEFDYKVGGSNTIELSSPISKIGYRLTEDKEIKEKEYYIIYQGYMCKLIKGEDNYYCDINSNNSNFTNWTGYFDSTGSYPIKFISDITGEIYDVYESINNIMAYLINGSYSKNQCFWVRDENGTSRQVVVIEPRYIQFLDGAANKVVIPDLSNTTIDFKIIDRDTMSAIEKTGYSFTLTIPSIGIDSPENWSELQKMAGTDSGHMIIDTAKKVIKWRASADSSIGTNTPFTGIADIISKGSLFKIPYDNFIEEEIFSYNKFIIEQDKSTWFEISNLKLTYHYMYK